MSENIEVEKLKVRASDLNSINKLIPSATINGHAVYVGSINNDNGYYSSGIRLDITQFMCNVTVHIVQLRDNTNEYVLIRKSNDLSNGSLDSTKILFVQNDDYKVYDIYVTGSYSSWYSVGYIYAQLDPNVNLTHPIGELVNVADLAIKIEYMTKNIPYINGGGDVPRLLISKYKAVCESTVNRRKHNYGLPLRFPISVC